MENKFIYRVKYKGVMYNAKLTVTNHRGICLEFISARGNEYLFETFRRRDTLDEVLEVWYELLEDKDVEIFKDKA